MAKLNFQNQTGDAGGKQIMIIALITVVAALMIVAIFTILSKNKTSETATDDFLKNINAGRPNQNQAPSGSAADNEPETLSYAGVLTEIKSGSIVISQKESQNKITFFLTPETPVIYNGQPFSRSKFYIGDQLEISAVNLGDKLRAESIKVLVSASPATAIPVPVTPNVSPSGSFRPLGVE